MSISLTPRHSIGLSAVHRLPGPLKVGVGLAIIVGTITVPSTWTPWYAGVFIFLAAGIGIAKVQMRFVGVRLLLLLPLCVGVILMNILQPLPKPPWLPIIVKSSLCLLTVILVSSTTPVTQILAVLRLVRVPDLLITTVALTHRYLFVLADEAERMRCARLSRTFTRRRLGNWKTIATVISQLFLRTCTRAERIYSAMCARGWK